MAAIEAAKQSAIDERRKYVIAWNTTMIKIWKGRIEKLGVIDTGALYRSPLATGVKADSDYFEIEVEEEFKEYGIWQDLGVGKEVPHGNPGDIGREKKRQRKKWFSTKYYASAMNLKEYLANSLGNQFIGIVAAGLDSDKLKRQSKYYRKKGWS